MAQKPGDKSASKRKVRDLKLNSLLEVTKAINNNVPTEQLLLVFESILKNQLNIGKALLFVNIDSWQLMFNYGISQAYNDINVERDLLHIKEIGTIDISQQNIKHDFEIVVPVYHKEKPLAYVLIGDIEDKMEVSPTIKHLPFIQTLANVIVVAIENKKLAKENIRQAAIQKELELASEMQAMLIPTTLPNNSRIETGAVYLPHQQVGGDYYDYIELNEHEFVVCMADVSGKGVAAALLMSNFQANLRALIQHTHDLTDLVTQLNSKVMMSAKGEKFITLFIARYNHAARQLHYINAGHNPPVLINKNEETLLKTGCTGLGMFDELITVKEGLVDIKPESVLVCYTDGVVELVNASEEEYGVERLSALIVQHNNKPIKQINENIIKSINTHKETRSYVDDITILSCRFI